jgi:hypothetical protein
MIKQLLKVRFYLLVVLLFSFMGVSVRADDSLHESMWYELKGKILLQRLPGRGEFVESQRDVDTKSDEFPLKVVSDGYRMLSVFENLMDNYIAEWVWRVTLKNKTMKEVIFSIEYKLQDKDSFLLASSQEQFRKIAPRGTLTIEKKEQLPYEKARQVTSRTLDIQLQK